MGKKWKWGFFLISPFALILYFILLIVANDSYSYVTRRYLRIKEDRIERITEIKDFPSFKVMEYTEGKRGFNGDYTDRFICEFDEIPSPEFYEELDSLCNHNLWDYRDGEYSFSTMWGNGIPAPKGESEEFDGIFGLYIKKNSREFTVTLGSW